jgi:hypothetical protein
MTQQDILYRAAFVRGYFINKVTYIEKMMEYYVAFYFCQDNDRAVQMINLLTGDRFVSFESKRVAFENTMKKCDTEMYNENKDKFEKLTTMQTERNRLAHLIVLLNDSAEKEFENTGSIALVKFANTSKPIWYTENKIKEIMTMCDSVSEWLNKIVKPQ